MNIDTYFKSKILFSIPIYFRSQNDWHKEYKKKENEYISNRKKHFEDIEHFVTKEKIISWEIHFNERSSIWRYNEIIGYLEVKYYNSILCSYLFVIDAKRFRPKVAHKRFLLDDISLPEMKISSSILKNLKEYIYSSIDQIIIIYPKFANYYYDLECVDNILSIVK